MVNREPHLGQLNLRAQGDFKRVLFVCTGGMLRSATAAQWASAALAWNTRNCGTMDAALPPAHPNLLAWAEVIYCMEDGHKEELSEKFPWAITKMKVLGIQDIFHYRSPKLIAVLEKVFEAELAALEIGE